MSDAHRPTIAVTTHAIAAGHYLAATAGFEILQAGGNAIDAGVAAGIALGVLQIDLVDFAGVAPIMIYHAEKREVVTIAGARRAGFAGPAFRPARERPVWGGRVAPRLILVVAAHPVRPGAALVATFLRPVEEGVVGHGRLEAARR